MAAEIVRSGVLVIAPFFPRKSNPIYGSFVYEQLKHLPKMGFRLSVLSPSSVRLRPEELPPEHGLDISSPNIDVCYPRCLQIPTGMGVMASGHLLAAGLSKAARNRISTAGISLIHAHCGALPGGHAAYLLGRRFNIPYVITIHGRDAYHEAQVKHLPLTRVAARLAKMVYENAATVICVSGKVRDAVLEPGLSQRNITVLHNGVDPFVFNEKVEIPEGLLRKYAQTRILLSVGNLNREKGQHLIIEALPQLAVRFPNIKYLLIGTGSYESELTSLAARLGVLDKVEFLGRRSRQEVAEYMSLCEVFALPSYNEAFGCVYVEAMAIGKPIIGCIGQGPEEIVSDGVDGFLVKPDPAAVLGVLSDVLGSASLREFISIRALQKVRNQFTWQASAAKLGAVYAGVIGSAMADGIDAVSQGD